MERHRKEKKKQMLTRDFKGNIKELIIEICVSKVVYSTF